MDMTLEERRRILRWIIKSAAGVIAYGLLLFLAAGRTDWVWGWVFIVMLAAVMAAHPLILIPVNPGLLAEREKGLWDRRVKAWDKWVAGLAAGLFPLASWIVAGLDARFGWTQTYRTAYHIVGTAMVLSGYALFLWAMASNAFFSEGVRIQTDRDHRVAEAGPYRSVRHPGYAGAIVAQLGTPVMLGSPWALIPGLGSAVFFVLRTHLEDKFLQKELTGYQEYTKRTRCRLLPRVW
jgi:protein-S-isoprenylcysteine O-methyltransferase Ste14